MANEMTDLVAVYDDYANAERAQAALIEKGFNRDHVQIDRNDSTRTQAAGSTANTNTAQEGGVSGFFHRLFGDDQQHADRGQYAEAITRGSTVLTATVDDSRVDEATEILNRFNPADFDQRVNDYSAETVGAGMRTGTAQAQANTTIPIVQEEIQVGKRSVQKGGVRVYTRVVSQPVEESVNLREEHVRVDRRPVNRPATEADLHGHAEVIELIETAEEAVVGKTSRVVEEVVIGKDTTQTTQQVRDTVRQTEVHVERLGTDQTGLANGVSDADDYRRDFTANYATEPGASYDNYAPAYQYGSTTAADPRYRGRNWSDVEDTIKTDYLRNNPNSAWDRMKGSVRYGYEKATSKR